MFMNNGLGWNDDALGGDIHRIMFDYLYKNSCDGASELIRLTDVGFPLFMLAIRWF